MADAAMLVYSPLGSSCSRLLPIEARVIKYMGLRFCCLGTGVKAGSSVAGREHMNIIGK